MSKVFEGIQTLDLAFDPAKVETSEYQGWLYTFGGKDDTQWRWLTPTEESEYKTWLRDHQRASDDGMGQAITTATDFADDNDLGVDWGKVAKAPNGTIEMAHGADVTSAKLDDLYGKAATMLSESRQDPFNQRFALLIFDMKDVDATTTKGVVDVIRLAGTAGDEMITDYIRARLYQKLRSALGAPTNELEI